MQRPPNILGVGSLLSAKLQRKWEFEAGRLRLIDVGTNNNKIEVYDAVC